MKEQLYLNKLETMLVYSAQKRAEAQKMSALGILEVYFNRAVAIGEHPDLDAEIDKYLELLAGANDRLDAIAYYKKHHREFSSED